MWRSIESNWIDRVTGWNRDGVNWRQMSAVEILWMCHSDNIVYLSEENKSGMRRYLTATKDFTMLRSWDAKQMSDRASDGGRGDL